MKFYIFVSQCNLLLKYLCKFDVIQGATLHMNDETGAIHIARVMRGGAADRCGVLILDCMNYCNFKVSSLVVVVAG